MKIFLTFDYELFFGSKSGSVEKCLIEPTKNLLELTEGKDVFLTFFVDVGYIMKAEQYPELNQEVSKVLEQLKHINQLGHDIQLHVHPHWEKANYVNGSWTMNTVGSYKLSDFSEEEASTILKKYKARLEKIKNGEVNSFRAGGWCIQPIGHIATTLKEIGIKYDSSVVRGLHMITENYALDFRKAPLKDKYRFETDVCIEEVEGEFVEYPILAYRYSPLFYWSLYLRGKLNPKNHKMIGDGTFISHGSTKFRQLLSYTNMHVSSDGYYSRKLSSGLEKCSNLGFDSMVVIGHPKGNTVYSLRKLKNFIEENHKEHQFVSFKNLV